ncbi:myeloid cell surface antigen CD33, partial [Austrofundulus limnaeus]|uniref:Myeloid cell surface antigen CD33 n=1 Tax=Austrofundulus limnaeus TaxID=52670 RepID=A0A2I4B8S4_AUSLI
MDKEKKIIVFGLLLAVVCSLVFCDKWTASVEEQIDAVVSTCVVVPCSFSHPGGELPSSRLRGIWHRKGDQSQIIYHDDRSRILDSFKERTKMLGSLGQGNCTLEIRPVNDHDNGPFCYRIELVEKDNNNPTSDKFSFTHNCVKLKMINEPPKPVLTHPETATQGKPYTAMCSVRHTCQSQAPKLMWSQGTEEGTLTVHQDIHHGIWEVESILTFIPEEEHDGTDLTCTATFSGGRTSSTSITINVKRTVNFNHIIIPVAVATSIIVIFGLFCIVMVKRYKNRIAELQNQDGRKQANDRPGPPPRPEKRRSMWDRLSRRNPQGNRRTPPRPEERRSEEDRVGWNTERRSFWNRFSRRLDDRANYSVGYLRTSDTVDFNTHTSKPRCPSPKNQKRRPAPPAPE